MTTNPIEANAAYNSQATYEARVAHEAALYQAQSVYEAQVYEAHAAYDAQIHEAQVAYEAQLAAKQPIIIHTTAHWFWQCHLCGHSNGLHNHVRDFWRASPFVLEMQSACVGTSSSVTRSNHANSSSRVHPNIIICGHDRCGWCFDLDEDMAPIRFSTGVGVTQEQYEMFWGWRFWAERVGLSSGKVRWEDYEEFCVRWFGGVPAMMPLPEALEEEPKEQVAGVGAELDARGQRV